jgi:RNA polymerase sigma factor (sigma-70 family)
MSLQDQPKRGELTRVQLEELTEGFCGADKDMAQRYLWLFIQYFSDEMIRWVESKFWKVATFADDIFSHALRGAWNSRHTFKDWSSTRRAGGAKEEHADLRAWFRGILEKKAIDRWRAEQCRIRTVQGDADWTTLIADPILDRPAEEATPTADVSRSEAKQAISDFRAGLDPEDRDLLDHWARNQPKPGWKSIAAERGVPENRLRLCCHRLRERLKKHLEDRGLA